MDKNYMIDHTPNQTHNFYLKKTLQFLLPISIISFLVSYFSVFSIIFHSLQFYSSIFPSLSQALDRKCMFLLCNGILAFLAKNLKLNHGENLDVDDEDGLVFHENSAYVDYVDRASLDAAVPEEIEIKVEKERDDIVSCNIDEDEDEGEDEGDEEVVEESASVKMEEVSDMRVSTEDLNKKFDEFIRKMKEEIRIEARQQYLILV